MTNCSKAIYVAITERLEVQIDGKNVPADDINSEMTRLSRSGHFIMYYRPNGSIDLSSEQQSKFKKVLDSAKRLKLPITMSSKPDFSDYIDDNGDSHPRLSCGK